MEQTRTADTNDPDAERRIDEHFLSVADGRTAPPGGFDYEEVFHSPKGASTRKMFKMLMGYQPILNTEQAHNIAMLNWTGDPPSDRAIMQLRQDGREVHAVMEAFITRGIDAVEDPPEGLREIWQQVSTVPDWLEWDRVERGARAYRRFGVLGHQYQGVASIDSYRNLPIARTLMSTGQYADDTAYKRYLLTCNFWTQISEPGGMRTFGEGWKVALRIRLLHSLIRRAVFGSERWDPEAFGTPINQLGLLAAPLVSSVLMCKSLKLLGFVTTDTEIEDVMHLWRYVAYIMGYQSGNHFPTTVSEGVQCAYEFSLLNPLSDDPDGIRLGSSFIEGFRPVNELTGREKWKRWWEYKTNIAQSAFFVQPETRRLIEAPNPWAWAILYVVSEGPRHWWQDQRRHRSETYARKLDEKVSADRLAWLDRQLQDADLVYRPASKY